jgi:hypothetical protein
MENNSFFRRQPASRSPVLTNVFRRDIFDRARGLVLGQAHRNGAEAQHLETGVQSG